MKYRPQPALRALIAALTCAAVVISFAGHECLADSMWASCRAKPEIVLITGLAGYWPRAGNLQARLRREGYSSSRLMGAQKREVVEKYAASRCKCCRSGPIVVGYSIGATHAIALANDLKSMNVRIPLLVLVDPTHAIPVPSNVGSCLNIYKSQPLTDWIPVMRGLPVTARTRGTKLTNYDVRRQGKTETVGVAHHLTIASNDRIQDKVVDEILRIDHPVIFRMTDGQLAVRR